jgi:hypothetical protein
MYKLKRHINFINENDNIKRSERGLDRFGMSNYDDLPSDLKEKAIKLGMKNIDTAGREGISTKSIYEIDVFNEEDGYEYSVVGLWISVDDDNKFTADSLIVFSIDMVGKHDFNIELFRNRYDYEDIMKMLDIIPRIKNEMEVLTAGFKTSNENRNKMLMREFLKDKGIDLNEKRHIGYYGGLS